MVWREKQGGRGSNRNDGGSRFGWKEKEEGNIILFFNLYFFQLGNLRKLNNFFGKQYWINTKTWNWDHWATSENGANEL